MARTRCEVRFAPAQSDADWTERGLEQAEFYISPNPGEDVKPLARIASGGELSRIMLALKTLGSNDAPGKTLIFDEVDTGIGGAVADVVGVRLQNLAKRFQVLCITHLPQIAAYGGTHLSISKSVKQGRTVDPRRPPGRRRPPGGTGADDWRERGFGGGPGERARDAGDQEDAGERRINGKSESEDT